jgi:hypothetical protein
MTDMKNRLLLQPLHTDKPVSIFENNNCKNSQGGFANASRVLGVRRMNAIFTTTKYTFNIKGVLVFTSAGKISEGKDRQCEV